MEQILDYLLDGAVTLLVSTPVYCLIRFAIVKKSGRSTRWQRELWMGIFWLFVIWLASETILPEFSLTAQEGGATLHFLPMHHITVRERLKTGYMMNFEWFGTIRRYTSFRDFGTSAVNLIGNVVMFLPLGGLPPLLWKRMRPAWVMLPIGVLCSIMIECIQLFIDRSVDIDDVLLNSIGVLLGYLCIRLVFAAVPKTRSALLYEKTV